MALGSALQLFLGPTAELVIASCHIESACCHTSQSDQEMAHRCCAEREKTTLQDVRFCALRSAHEASSFLTFPVCFKCRTTLERLMLSSGAASRVVVRGSSSMMALGWLLLTSDGQPLHSSSRLSAPLPNFFNHYRACTYTC